MQRPLAILVVAFTTVTCVYLPHLAGDEPPVQRQALFDHVPAWPPVRRAETRPWTWWWWHGCAVNKADITRNLEALHDSGIGGVNIVCLLDVRDDQATKLPYLSKEWMEAVAHTVREGRRLGMGVDMSPVSGWAFGGSWVPLAESSAIVNVQRLTLQQCREQDWRIANWKSDGSGDDAKDLSAVMAFSPDGRSLDLRDKVNSNGILQWEPPTRDWTIYVVHNRPGSSAVRMATPGCKGPVVDHLSAQAVRNYFAAFDKAFSLVEKGDLPRAYNNDSWEICLNWTRDFFAKFEKYRGYDLHDYLPAFMGEGPEDLVSRVTCDYRNTLSDLMLDEFTVTFRNWAAGHGGQISGEVSGEPGNELDLAALYDIPQVDYGGGPRSFYISDGDIDTELLFGHSKLRATSPAHLLGKPLITSETLTCLGPILDTSLEMVKENVDLVLLSGANHIMFHGIAYSPAQARWPGWLFYAGTHLGPFNPMWRQGRQLCDYVTRCQSFLQQGTPDADVLVYFPVFDQWSRREPSGTPAYFKPWDKSITECESCPKVSTTAVGDVSLPKRLWRAGHDFDYVSDRLLESVRVVDGRLVAPGTSYKALVIPRCCFMPETTLERIVRIVEDGGTVIMPDGLPADVPGLNNLAGRRERFTAALAKLEAVKKTGCPEAIRVLGEGRIVFGGDIVAAMERIGVARERMTDLGLKYVRRRDQNSTTYFIFNLAENRRIDGWVPLAAAGASAALFDPMTGRSGMAAYRKDEHGTGSVKLQLDPRQTCIVRVFKDLQLGAAWRYFEPTGDPITIEGPWSVRFLEGGEKIPHPETVEKLDSWTQWQFDQSQALRYFSGVACYTTRFHGPDRKADAWAIELGEVRHTARVRLNGKVLGDLISRPMRVVADSIVRDGENLLEIEVANASINRAVGLELAGVPWQKTLGEDGKSYRIGDFLHHWKNKDSSWVPRPSGLLGPVLLVPLADSP